MQLFPECTAVSLWDWWIGRQGWAPLGFGAERLAWGLGAQGYPTHLCNGQEHCVEFGLCRRVRAGLRRTGLGEVLAWERWDGIFPADSQNVPYFPILSAWQLWGLLRSGEIFDFGIKVSHFVPLGWVVGGVGRPRAVCRNGCSQLALDYAIAYGGGWQGGGGFNSTFRSN